MIDHYKLLVEKVHILRKNGEVEACVEMFAQDAELRIVGSASASRVATTVVGSDAISDLTETMLSTWDWRKVSYRNVLVDGNKVAAQYSLKAVFVPNNQEVELEIVDIVEFTDDKIVRLDEFLDTAFLDSFL